MGYRICVDGFGKIEHAEIESSPLTLFVGDNNSGKSYLLSLIWALHSGTQLNVLLGGDVKNESSMEIRNIVSEQLKLVQNGMYTEFEMETKDLVDVINVLMEKIRMHLYEISLIRLM